jgi:tetratricopeptide (TPR) repeat protein
MHITQFLNRAMPHSFLSRHFSLALVLLLIIVTLSESAAQHKRTIRQAYTIADGHFDARNYTQALKYYAQVLQEDSADWNANVRLAECHRLLHQFAPAAVSYRKAYTLDPVQSKPLLFYQAQMLKYQGKYEQAIVLFNAYLSQKNVAPYDRFRAEFEMSGASLALDHQSGQPQVRLETLPGEVNTTQHDLPCAPYLSDSLLPVLHRHAAVQPAMHLYKANGAHWQHVDLQERWEERLKPYQCGPGIFSAKGNAYYFSAGTHSGQSEDLYAMYLVAGQWQTPIKLPMVPGNESFRMRHPALTGSGDTLIFSANLPGGLGGFDLWYIVKDEADRWSQPLHLGAYINTPEDEVSPYFEAATGRLFFASDGHIGYGGLDIFVADAPFSTSLVHNLGAPFNSGYHDAHLVLGKSIGYFASQRGTANHFDVFSFSLLEPEEPNPKGQPEMPGVGVHAWPADY